MTIPATDNLATPSARDFVQGLESSGIRTVVRSCAQIDDLIPLWFGEGDLPTPKFIRDAAAKALSDGETFYTPNLGRDDLRSAIAAYQSNLLGTKLTAQNVCVTGSGMNALSLVAQSIIEPGDKVVCITPTWPNLPVSMEIMGGDVTRVALQVVNGTWSLDLDALGEAMKIGPKALMINSPSNPTGWMASADEIAQIVELAEAHGTWIVTDDVYSRIVYDKALKCAPTALSHLARYPRVLSINSFSKTWAMTGWRLGWISAAPEMIKQLEKLMEFSISCVSPFVQAGAIAALEQGEDFLDESLNRFAEARQMLLDASKCWSSVEIIQPDAAFYAMLKVDGLNNDLDAAKQMANEIKVGLAPGSAFGDESQGQFRLCYAVGRDTMARAIERLDRKFA